MADTDRHVRVRFSGDSKGLAGAAKDGERSISAWQRQLDRARGTLGRTTKASDEFGQAAEAASRKARTAAQNLDRQIDTLRSSLKGLAVDFAGSGDNGIAKQMRDAERELRKLVKARNLIGDDDDGEAVKHGVRFGARFAEGLSQGLARAGGPISSALSSVFGSLPPQAQAAIGAGVVAAAATAAPLIGGVISGAVVGGVGIGGVVGGMVIASQHADVKAAAKSTGDTLKETLQRSAIAFVPATVDALGIVRDEIGSMEGDLRRVFSKASRFVEPLTRGVTGFLQNLLPGIEYTIDRAGPIITELASWGPKLGTLLSDVFGQFADHAWEGSRALAAFWLVFDFGIRTVASSITVLATTFGWMEKIGLAATGQSAALAALVAAEEQAKQKNAEHATGLQFLEEAMRGYGAEAEDATTKNQRLLTSMQQLTSAAQGGRMATIDFHDGLAQLKQSVQDNGTTLDVTSEKGRANLRVVEGLISAADRAGQAAEQRALAEGQSAEGAAAAGARIRQTLVSDLQAAADKAGLSKEQIKAMVREIEMADGKRANMTVTVTTVKRVVDMSGDSNPRASNGEIGFFAGGGRVGGRGTGTSDSNWARVSRDEFVIRAKAARAIGYDTLEAANQLGGGQARSVLAARDYLAAGSGGATVSSGGAAPAAAGMPDVRVFIGERELTDIVRVEVGESNRQLKRRVLAGAGVF